MKLFKTLLLSMTVMALAYTGCSNPTSGSGDEGKNGGNVDVNRFIEVTDADGTFVGYLVSTDLKGGFLIMTENGYFVTLLINGEIVYNLHDFYFSDTDYTGTCVTNLEGDSNIYYRQTPKQVLVFKNPDNADAEVIIFEPDPSLYTDIVEVSSIDNYNYKSYFQFYFDAQGATGYNSDCDETERLWGFYITESTHEDATMLKNLTGPLSFTVSD